MPAEPETFLQCDEILDQFSLAGPTILLGGESGALGTVAVAAAIIGRLIGRPAKDEEVRIRAVALSGQFQVFHVCRRMALRLLDWDEIDVERQALVKSVVRDHTREVLRALATKKRLQPRAAVVQSKRRRPRKEIDR
jgi:HTH-type transcriptional dual regulator CecR, C-terminal domain